MTIRDVLPRDAIPSIDDPAFGRDYAGEPDDEVVAVEGDPPRAYPIRILSYHEIVNDVVRDPPALSEGAAATRAAVASGTEERADSDGTTGSRARPDDVVDERPIAVTWCPICWSAAVYDRVVDGRTLTFGVSGKLADDALVMYDRETGSEWKQPSGTAIAGEFEGRQLAALPFAVLSWERFEAEYPDGEVLQPVRGTAGDLSRGDVYDVAPYERYVDGDDFGLYGMRGEGVPRSWDRDDVDAKTVVLGVEHGGRAVAYPIPQVEAAGGIVGDSVGGLDVVVLAADGTAHAFEDPGFEFERIEGNLRADGATWDALTGESDDGRRLARVPARTMFAFAWQDEHGRDAFYQVDGDERSGT